jgi:hypothetical protein
MPEALAPAVLERVPRLAELVGAATLEAQWEGRRAVYLWQIERDLALLSRHVGWPSVAATYRASLRNPEELWAVAYELRTAAKLAPVVDGIELRPLPGVGPRGEPSREDAGRAVREAKSVVADVRMGRAT